MTFVAIIIGAIVGGTAAYAFIAIVFLQKTCVACGGHHQRKT